ncbi:helix-turn-helix domain-containing protein [Polaribacter uvawellassae]|uniref:helix-turn-helix domain-containing protein n=1 Tax=Polaribacter uvawellassae TaxID=3133495 RepID=UPI00321A53BA
MKYNFFLIFFLCSCSFSMAQTEQLNKSYTKKIEKFGNTNIDSLFYYAKESQKSNDPCTKNLGIISEANAYYKSGDFDTSEKICLKVIEDLKSKTTSCNYKILLSAYNRLFWIKKNQAKYDKAFQYLLEKKKIIETIPERNMYYYLHKLGVNNNIAGIKEILGLHNEAIQILKETNTELQKLSNDNTYYFNHLKVLHSSNLNMIGDNFFNIGKDSVKSYLDSAGVYYKKAYSVALGFNPPNKNSKQLYTLRKTKVQILKKEFKKALEELSLINNVDSGITKDICFYKSLIYYNLNKKDSTLIYANKFLYSDATNATISKDKKIIIYDVLANQYNNLQKTDSAYKYSRLGLKELSELTLNKSKINKSHYKYNFNQIKENNDVTINLERKTHLIQLLFICLLSIFLIVYLVNRSKKKRRKNKESFDFILNEIQTKESHPKKEYKIEKELEATILKQLDELEESTEFLKSDFNINILAKKLETNTSYLSYIINNTKNQSFKQYITKLRIDYLIKKLNTKKQYQQYTIQYLAEEIGYTNASAFTRAFKKEVGVTPSEYIKSLKD